MKINILFFGIATDLVGATSLDFETTPEATISEFKNELQSQFPNLTEINSYAIAVNESYASSETTLKENDVVAIIPPVSGG